MYVRSKIMSILFYESNISEAVTNHLVKLKKIPKPENTRKPCQIFFKWRYMFDEKGNPSFDSTDSDISSVSKQYAGPVWLCIKIWILEIQQA